jgi:hypothetical protein
MVPEFEEAVAGVPVGQITTPFRTPFGWHVVRRDAVVEIGARHVLVAYAGAWRSAATWPGSSTRPRPIARKWWSA